MLVADLPTPALVVDAGALTRNLDTMTAALPGARLRPHVKAHKCTALAREQARRGHGGFTGATPRELLGLARAGLGEDLLLANESVDDGRLRALATSGARVTVVAEAERCTGLPGMANRPRIGCSRFTTMPRSTSPGSERTSPESRTAPQGMPAPARISIASCLVRFSVHASMSGSISPACSARACRSASRGSSPSSGRPRIRVRVRHMSRVAQWMKT